MHAPKNRASKYINQNWLSERRNQQIHNYLSFSNGRTEKSDCIRRWTFYQATVFDFIYIYRIHKNYRIHILLKCTQNPHQDKPCAGT